MTAHRPETPMSDLESLSALFDGELEGDAARFAMKRLGHDPEWQQACGNWQLIGDALRGRATTAAPGDFAARVSAAVAREAVPVMVPEPRPAPALPVRARPRRWMAGAALAASVAAAALFVARPAMDPQPAPTTTVVAAPAATPAGADVAPALPVETLPSAPSSVQPATAVAAAGSSASVPVAGARETVARARPAAVRARAVAARSPVRATRPRDASAGRIDAAAELPVLAEVAADPFRPSQAPITTRPWPRAVLPGSTAGVLTASFGSTPQAGAPSFYPFEPRLPAEPAATNPAPQP